MKRLLRHVLCLAALLAPASPAMAEPAHSAPGAAATAPAVPDSADGTRLIPLKGALNARDLGGMKGAHGAIHFDHFIRSANLANLTPADREELYRRHVVLDIDLRTADEERTSPDVLGNDPHIRYTRISLLGIRPANATKLPPSLLDIYVDALKDDQPEFKEVFEAIASAGRGGVLYHCTVGKDRTGMISAMLLQLAGVPRDDIVHNYALSAYYLQPMLLSPQMKAMFEKNPSMRDYFASPPEVIEGFLDVLDHQYGGTAAYLRSIGVPARDIVRIRRRLAA